MSELHYGKNVEWFLRELSAHEAGDIESAEIEVIGENDQGVEGFTTIDITLLAADAVSVISALQQKLDAAHEEIARRDAIFIPVYPDENLMNKLTDVFHDTAKIHCDEDGVFVNNAELVITAVINHYLQSPDRDQLRSGSNEGGV